MLSSLDGDRWALRMTRSSFLSFRWDSPWKETTVGRLSPLQSEGKSVGSHRSEDAPRRRRTTRHVGAPPLIPLALVIVVIVALVTVGNSFDSGVRVAEGEFGAAWPLTVSQGILRCEYGSEITFQSDGTTYTLRRSTEHGENNSDIAPIWGQVPAGMKKDLTPLIEKGVTLCDR
jgi:hypothetical protein